MKAFAALLVVLVSFAALAEIRIVNGRAYETTKSKLWKQCFVEVSRVGKEGVMGVEVAYVKSEKIYRTETLVKNYTTPGVATGSTIHFRAMEVGTTNIGSQTFKVYDCGTLPVKP